MTKEEKPPTKSADQIKSRGSRDGHQKKDKVKPLTKVVIRHLPPTMTELEFLKQIDPLPEHDYYYYATADWSLGFDATCRAYITFRNHDDVFLFRDRFDGYVFVDTKGEEYPAIVEFAPFQGLPKNKARKVDPKVNSIESEQHYINFLQKLEEDREACKSECKLEFSLQPKDEKKITSTPLLQFLMTKKIERREEQKKRNEDHRRKREEEKQKRRNQVSKGIPSAIKEEGALGKDGKPKPEGGGDQPEEKKSSRAKRRAERDQRRREEHELRRKEKERAVKNEQKPSQTSEDQHKLSKESEKPITIAKPEGDNKRKEVKKYSERRERNRPKHAQPSTSVTQNTTVNPTITAVKTAEEKNPPVKEDYSTFIKNLTNVKEFIPKHKQEAAVRAEKKSEEKKSIVDMEEVMEKLEKISLQVKSKVKALSPDKEDDHAERKYERERSQRNSSSSGGNANDNRSEDRFDRRIRNKDRPSIAIYQPGKTRLRLSDEGQPGNDGKSNPTSDTESLKKEERSNTGRKVSRYSERRSGRARDGKRRNSGEDKGGSTLDSTATDTSKEEKPEKPAEEMKEVEKVEKVEN